MISIEKIRSCPKLSFLNENDWRHYVNGDLAVPDDVRDLAFVIDQINYVSSSEAEIFGIYKQVFGHLTRYEKEFIMALRSQRLSQSTISIAELDKLSSDARSIGDENLSDSILSLKIAIIGKSDDDILRIVGNARKLVNQKLAMYYGFISRSAVSENKRIDEQISSLRQ